MAKNDLDVEHINVRQSIAFLVMKLVVIEIFFGFVFYFIAFPPGFIFTLAAISPFGLSPIRMGLFVFLIFAKMFCSFIVVYQWLNNYYEITPKRLIHRKGFIFRKEQSYDLKQVKLIEFRQSLFGRILNYGTIHLFDPYAKKEIYIYLIHNPLRYYRLLKDFIPMAENEREVFSFEKIAED